MSRGYYDKINKVRVPTAGKEKFDVDNALSSESQNAVENRIINAEFGKTYRTTDSADSIADDDYIPFYDASESRQKKSTWANIKSTLPSGYWSITGEEATWHFDNNQNQ